MGGKASPLLEQTSYRGRNDDGSESAATWKAAANNNWVQDTDVNFRLRFLITEYGGASVANVKPQLQYNLASGGWNDVNAASSVARSSSTTNYTEDDDTTQQIGSGSFVSPNAGCDDQEGLAGETNEMDFTANDECEAEFCLTIRSGDVSDGQTIEFRITNNGTVMDNYANTPSIEINIPPSTAAFDQDSFRGRKDDDSETAATWKAAANTDWNQSVDVNFRVRFLVQETNGIAAANKQFQLQYNKNSGGWNDVNASSSNVKASASPNFLDGSDSTQQIGAGTFITPNGAMDEVNGLAGDSNLDFAGSDEVEVEFAIQIVSTDVSWGDTIDLRVVDEGGTALDTYTNTPTITVIACKQGSSGDGYIDQRDFPLGDRQEISP